MSNLVSSGGNGSNGTVAQTPSSGGDGTILGLRDTDWGYLIIFAVALLILAYLAGKLFADAYDDEIETKTSKTLGKIESRLFRWTKIDTQAMDWKTYAIALLLFSVLGILSLTLIIMFQNYLPLNPQHLGPVSPDLAFNTAVSFVTNTNWQNYAGETTMSYFVQMAGLTVHNFLSAATGIAVVMALIRGIHRKSAKDLGNFWVDMSRATIILLPLAFILAIILVSQGSVQTLNGPIYAHLLQPVVDSNGNIITTQIIPVGPVASQEAIKMLGTNGGGFFNTNSAHPFENPTPLTNMLETLAMLVIPIGLCFTYGRMIKDRRQGIAILIAMVLIFSVFLGIAVWSEQTGNPALTDLGASQIATNIQPGGNMEGKEVRFGITPSCLFDSFGHWHLLWCGRLDVRFIYAFRRVLPPYPHSVRRGCPRRGRFRNIRDVGLCIDRRFRRRSDDR